MAQNQQPLANFQYGIYLTGVGGQVPDLPLTYEGMEAQARTRLDDRTYAYIAGGAGSEDTMRSNLEAFRRRRILPRMLRDVGTRDLSTTVLGTTMPAPVMLAPVGVQGIAHPDGELAVARAASSLGVPFILSTAASHTLEQVAEAAGAGPRWYQLYWPRDPELTVSFIQRAEAAGYSALVVTVDTTLLAWRPRDLAGGYLPFLAGDGIQNYLSDPVFRSRLAEPPEENPQAAVMQWVATFSDPTITWERLDFIRTHTRLPILLKGILHPDDARRAAEAGVDGLIVSNHGGRQVDGSIAALDALRGVVESVPPGFPVLLDSGVRGGADVFKAIAMGAQAVLVGRLFMWGLACAGEAGVRHVLQCLLAEFDLTMALTGHSRTSDVDGSAITQP